MRSIILFIMILAVATAAPSYFVNPVCVHSIDILGAPTVPGGDFVQVFVTGVKEGTAVFITLRWDEGSQALLATAGPLGAIGIFHVAHGAKNFVVTVN